MADGSGKGRYLLTAVGLLVINIMICGIFSAQGFLFVEFIRNYEVDRKIAIIPFSVRSAVKHLAAPVISILAQKYGTSRVTVIGGILASLSSALSYFAADIVWMTIIWGGMNGFTLAMMNILPQTVINQYFVKHESTAIGLSFCGCSVSAFILPPILEMFLKTYGLCGTFLILAGFFMHTIPGSMLVKSPPCYVDDVQASEETDESSIIKEDDCANVRKYRKASTSQKKRDFGIQVGNDKMYDFCNDRKIWRNVDCKRNSSLLKRSHSHGSLSVQAHLNNLQLTTMFPRVSSIELNCRTFNKSPENIYDVDIDYLKKQSDLIFHMLSMEIPNVEISYRAILLEVEQDDLWHPEQNEMLQEIENIYRSIEKSHEIDEISYETGRPSGPYLKKTLLNGALSINNKSESLRVVKRYLKTYKERGLQQFRKIRSAPNMSNIYNEIARKEYVMTKMKELCNGNEIRIISQLCQYNPKDVLRVLFQLRTLYNLYNDLECCDKSDNEELSESLIETGDIWSHRKESCDKMDFIEEEKQEEIKYNSTTSLKIHIRTAINLHTKLIFLLVCGTRATFFLSFIPLYIIVVDFGIDKEFEISDGKYLIGALSLGDLVGRLCFEWITNRGYVKLSQFMIMGMILQGSALISLPIMHSKWTILLSLILCGVFHGSLYVKHPALIVKYFTPKDQSVAIGWMDVIAGILLLFLPLYIGYFRDTMGSYDPIYYINGAVTIIFGVAWAFESCFVNQSEDERKN